MREDLIEKLRDAAAEEYGVSWLLTEAAAAMQRTSGGDHD